MELKKMTKEEIEALSYTDLALLIVKENKKSMNTPAIFKKICELLGLSDSEYESGIGDFYTSLTTDKRFILLDDATWDLREKHSVKISFDEDEEDDDEDVEMNDEEENETEEESEEDDMETALDDEDIPDDDDDMEDLSIMEEEEELEEN